MPRIRYPRPTVHLWVGKSGQKYWEADWHQGQKHRVERWLCSKFSKREAQQACDVLVQEESGVQCTKTPLTVREYWEKVFWPIVERRLSRYSRANYASAWRKHIEPAIGKLPLQHVVKHVVECILGTMADAGLAEASLERVLAVVHELFDEAVENGFVTKSPARNIKLPRCRPDNETVPLTELQVKAIFEATEGRDRLMWRILLLTGCRPGELFALAKSDIVPDGIRIDESATWGRIGTTKNRKTRIAPIPPQLRQELLAWIAGVEGHLVFPGPRGKPLSASYDEIRAMLAKTRQAAKLPKLTFRQCRTTFATLYRGDPKDLQAILGHYDARITMETYRKGQQDRQQASVDELEVRLKGRIVEMPKRESA